ncbi:hypothetical protein Trydic_g18689, partial [Trypoxylus dichotomus]
ITETALGGRDGAGAGEQRPPSDAETIPLCVGNIFR